MLLNETWYRATAWTSHQPKHSAAKDQTPCLKTIAVSGFFKLRSQYINRSLILLYFNVLVWKWKMCSRQVRNPNDLSWAWYQFKYLLKVICIPLPDRGASVSSKRTSWFWNKLIQFQIFQIPVTIFSTL